MSTTAIEGKEYPNDQVVRDFVCAACGGELREFWGETREGDWVICLTNPAHRGFVKRMTAWVEERKESVREMEVKTNQTTALVATEQEAEIERWAKRLDRLPLSGPQDKVKLIKYAAARMAVVYGLDPFLGELVIIPHKKDGQVVDLSLYAAIGGMRRVARRTEEYEGRELAPATKKERQDLKITDDTVHVWKCLVFRKGYSRPFDGFGIFPMLKQDQYSPADPALMARKRAEHQALRAAFDLNIPLFEPEIEEEKPSEVTTEEAPLLNSNQVVEKGYQRLQELIDEARGLGVPNVEIVGALEETAVEEDADLHSLQVAEAIAKEQQWRTEHGITRDGEPPLEEEEASKWPALPEEAVVELEMTIQPASTQPSPAEEIYGPDAAKKKSPPERPGVDWFWKFYNEEAADLVSLKDAQAILDEHPTVLEAMEALKLMWQSAIKEQEGSG